MLKNFSQFVNEKRGEDIRIFCDLDGVLVDFNRGFKNLEENSDKLTPKEYDKEHGKHSMWKIIDPEGEKFWIRLKWTKDGRELWDYLTRYNPIILSSPSRSKHSIPGKMEWIKRNLGITQAKPTTSASDWDPKSRIILSSDKFKFARSKNDILIDDTRAKLEKWTAAGGTGIFHNDATDTIRVLEEIFTKKD